MLSLDGLSLNEDGKPIMPEIHEYGTLICEVLAEGMKLYEYL